MKKYKVTMTDVETGEEVFCEEMDKLDFEMRNDILSVGKPGTFETYHVSQGFYLYIHGYKINKNSKKIWQKFTKENNMGMNQTLDQMTDSELSAELHRRRQQKRTLIEQGYEHFAGKLLALCEEFTTMTGKRIVKDGYGSRYRTEDVK